MATTSRILRGHPDTVLSAQEIEDYAKYIGLNPETENHLMWISQEALLCPCPANWEEYQDHGGNKYYYNKELDVSTWEHPLDAFYRELVNRKRTRRKCPNDESSSVERQRPALMSRSILHRQGQSEDGDDMFDGEDVELRQKVTLHGVIDMALILSIKPKMEPQAMRIAREAFLAPLPQDWAISQDDDGDPLYVNALTGATTHVRPIDARFSKLLARERDKGALIGDEGNATQKKNRKQWMKFTDDDGQTFFYNFATDEKTFQRPPRSKDCGEVSVKGKRSRKQVKECLRIQSPTKEQQPFPIEASLSPNIYPQPYQFGLGPPIDLAASLRHSADDALKFRTPPSWNSEPPTARSAPSTPPFEGYRPPRSPSPLTEAYIPSGLVMVPARVTYMPEDNGLVESDQLLRHSIAQMSGLEMPQTRGPIGGRGRSFRRVALEGKAQSTLEHANSSPALQSRSESPSRSPSSFLPPVRGAVCATISSPVSSGRTTPTTQPTPTTIITQQTPTSPCCPSSTAVPLVSSSVTSSPRYHGNKRPSISGIVGAEARAAALGGLNPLSLHPSDLKEPAMISPVSPSSSSSATTGPGSKSLRKVNLPPLSVSVIASSPRESTTHRSSLIA